MLEIHNLYKSYPNRKGTLSVIEDLSFHVSDGEFFVILGESGCGKSTLLRLIAGFDQPDSGGILLDHVPVRAPSSDRLMVFQSFDQLFPWYTLRENLIYGMKKIRLPIPRQDLSAHADRYLAMAGLSGFETHYPHQLSGGMKQRGALARALCLKPKVLLMDEPFSSLDYLTKQNSYGQIREMAAQTGCTILLVTHDIAEAVALGNAIAIFSKAKRTFTRVYRSCATREHLQAELERVLTEHDIR